MNGEALFAGHDAAVILHMTALSGVKYIRNEGLGCDLSLISLDLSLLDPAFPVRSAQLGLLCCHMQ